MQAMRFGQWSEESMSENGDWGYDEIAQFREDLRILRRKQFSDSPCLRLKRGGQVYLCGRLGRCVYLVESGHVKTYMTNASGKRCLLRVFGAGEVFGDLGLLGGVRTESAEALEVSVLWKIPAARFLDELAEQDMLQKYLWYLGQRVLDEQKIIIDMMTMESEQRLAARLLHLALQMGIRHGSRIHIQAHVTQEDLAEMVGTTRSRIGLFLKRFHDAGFVDVGRRSLLVDIRRLADYAQD
jgi:CRP/FNR family transcriptional regulator, cyclic AMP receptor protein